MGYFPNGSSGMDYEERYCRRCAHHSDDEYCPVMLLHSLWNYEQVDAANAIYEGRDPGDTASAAKHQALLALIPEGKGGVNDQCRMFAERVPAPTRQQLVMLEVRETLGVAA